jgi:LAO/AO transport system kinase
MAYLRLWNISDIFDFARWIEVRRCRGCGQLRGGSKKVVFIQLFSCNKKLAVMGDQTGELIKQVKAESLQALARLLTALEREGPACLARHPELVQSENQAFRVGITGPPGAGKSTLIGQLIGRLRAQGLRVGVIAVDPSSPFSKGAVLGDRIRYTEHFADPGVFIRSLGSRGSLGGLSSSAYLMVRAFDLAKFDVVLLETVGVGQTELEIMNVADWVSVVLVPESGDSIQGMKAGLMEIADLYVVNKGDRPGAEIFIRELEAALMLDPRAPLKPVAVIKTTATMGEGLDELVARIGEEMRESGPGSWREERQSVARLRAEAQALLREAAEREIQNRTLDVSSAEDFVALFRSEK